MKILGVLLLALFMPIGDRSHAQEGPQDCFGCLIGIWDDATLTTSIGTITPHLPKDIYVGIKYAGGYDALSGIEFSIAGMRFQEDGITLLAVTEIVPIAIRLGVFQAPDDTSSTSTETGGINLAWSGPVVGERALVKLTILTLEPVTNKILQVKRRYPTTNPLWQTPSFNLPVYPYTAVRVRGGCYILNWSGEPDVGCNLITSIEQATWSVVKRLYR